MGLPPEIIRLLLDFLAAVGSLFYLVGGYSLGKRQSEKSVVDNFAGEQYEQGSDQGKLTGPPFEEMKAGAKTLEVDRCYLRCCGHGSLRGSLDGLIERSAGEMRARSIDGFPLSSWRRAFAWVLSPLMKCFEASHSPFVVFGPFQTMP